MNSRLWVLQIALSLHTLLGSLWKFSNSEAKVPSLGAIPHGAWLAMSALELLLALGLVLPALSKRLALLAPLSAACIAAEMLLFSAVHLQSGAAEHGQLVYWLVVAAVCGLIVRGRLARQPAPAHQP